MTRLETEQRRRRWQFPEVALAPSREARVANADSAQTRGRGLLEGSQGLQAPSGRKQGVGV